jgi:hypothetical protein
MKSNRKKRASVPLTHMVVMGSEGPRVYNVPDPLFFKSYPMGVPLLPGPASDITPPAVAPTPAITAATATPVKMTGSVGETERRPAKKSSRPCRVFVYVGPPPPKADAGPYVLAASPLATGPALAVDPPLDLTLADDPMPNYEESWDLDLNTFPEDFSETALGQYMF